MDIYLSLCLSSFLFVSPARIIMRVLHEADEDIEKQLRMHMCVCECVSFLIFLILLLLLFTIYLLKLLISLFAEERKPRGNLAYCYWCRCFLSPATVARSSLLLLHCLLATPHSPIPFTFLSLSLFLCFSLSLPPISLSFLWQIQSTLLLIDSA